MPHQLLWSGEKIRELRQRLGWSQAELARRLGCRQQTVSEWETNTYQPQNAYSQLLDQWQADSDSANRSLRLAPIADAVMKDLNVSQVNSTVLEQSDEFVFDSFID